MRYFEAALGFVFQHWNSYYRISFILGRCTKIQDCIPGLYLYHPRVRLVGIRRVYKLVTSTCLYPKLQMQAVAAYGECLRDHIDGPLRVHHEVCQAIRPMQRLERRDYLL